MSRKPKRQQPSNLDIACGRLGAHPAFRRLMRTPTAAGPDTPALLPTDLAVVGASGVLYVNVGRRLEISEWQWVVAHALLHLGLGHARCVADRQPPVPDAVEVAVACVEANRFLDGLGVGRAPIPLPEMPRDEPKILERRWRRDGVPEQFQGIGTTAVGPDFRHTQYVNHVGRHTSWTDVFAAGLHRPSVRRLTSPPAHVCTAIPARDRVSRGIAHWAGSSRRTRCWAASRPGCGSWRTVTWRVLRRSASPPSTPDWARSTSTRTRLSRKTSGDSCSPTRCCTPRCVTPTASGDATRTSSMSRVIT